MSGYRGGIFKCPFYFRDYRDYLNCEGAQLRLEKEPLSDYAKRFCAGTWQECTIAQALLKTYGMEKEHEI